MEVFSVASFFVVFIIGITNGSPTGSDSCSRCQNMIISVNSMFDEEKRNEILYNICEDYAVGRQELCTELIQMSPADLCQQFGQCTQSSLVYKPKVNFTLGVSDIENSHLPCVLCENIMKIAHAFLKSKAHQKFLLHAMKSICHFVPFLTKECGHLVDTYGPLAIHLAAQYLTPASCTLFHLCPTGQTVFGDKCELCRFGVGVIYDAIQDPALETRIQEFTQDMCEEYVGSYEECKSMAQELTQYLLPVAEKLRNSDILKTACQKAEICSDDEGQDVWIDY